MGVAPVALICGIVLGEALEASVPGLVALVALGLSLGIPTARAPGLQRGRGLEPPRRLPRVGFLLSLLSLGVLASELQNAGIMSGQEALDLERPVTIVVSRRTPWRLSETGWSASAVGLLVRQGTGVRIWREALQLQLGSAINPPDTLRLRLRGYLRRPVGVANGHKARSARWRLRVKSDRLILAGANSRIDPLIRATSRVRKSVAVAVGRWPSSSDGRKLTMALVLGDRQEMPARWLRALRRTGLSHLLAISGLHVGVLIATVGLVAGWLPGRARWVAMLLAPTVYLILVGPAAGLMRAALMTWLVVQGFWLRRIPHTLNSLLCSAAMMLLLVPRSIHELGFQMTFAATAGIVSLAPGLEQRSGFLPEPVRRLWAASLAAMICVLPILLPIQQFLTPGALLWNLAAVPWMTVALCFCLIAALAETLLPGWGRFILPWIDGWALPLEGLCRLSPALAPVVPAAANPVAASLYAVLAAGFLLGRRRIALAALIALVALWLCAQPRFGDDPELVMIDVGQGDSFLIRDGDETLLLDGGGWGRADIGARVLVPTLVRLGVRRLDRVVLTHPDSDHCQGLVDLSGYLIVDEIWLPPGWRPTACLHELLTSPSGRSRFIWENETLRVGRWRLRALHPPAGGRTGRNERSLVLMARVGKHSVLLTGDLDVAGENLLLRSHPSELGMVDVLKVGHHGSRTSTGERFLKFVDPAVALISVGRRNRYGHPSEQVIERLRAQKSVILRTDRDGLVRMRFPSGGLRHIELPSIPVESEDRAVN